MYFHLIYLIYLVESNKFTKNDSIRYWQLFLKKAGKAVHFIFLKRIYFCKVIKDK